MVVKRPSSDYENGHGKSYYKARSKQPPFLRKSEDSLKRELLMNGVKWSRSVLTSTSELVRKCLCDEIRKLLGKGLPRRQEHALPFVCGRSTLFRVPERMKQREP